MNDGLADVDRRVVGTKQVLRALDEGKVAHAYVAQDADLLLTKRVVDRCYDMDIPCTQVESMEKLGRACGIDETIIHRPILPFNRLPRRPSPRTACTANMSMISSSVPNVNSYFWFFPYFTHFFRIRPAQIQKGAPVPLASFAPDVYSARSASMSAVFPSVFSSFILTMRAGTPATTAFSGTSRVTTAPAAPPRRFRRLRPR